MNLSNKKIKKAFAAATRAWLRSLKTYMTKLLKTYPFLFNSIKDNKQFRKAHQNRHIQKFRTKRETTIAIDPISELPDLQV